MKTLIYWLMGDKAGRVLISSWHWLWGLPIQSSNTIAVEVAAESLASMQQSVIQLTQTISTVMAAYQRAKQKYEIKEKEFYAFEQQAAIAYRQENEQMAHLAMSKAILIEQLLPELKAQVIQAEKVVMAAKDKLSREQQKLETYKVHLQNLKDVSEINEALAAIAKANTDLKIDAACEQFETAKSAVERRNLQISAQVELSESSINQLESNLTKMALDEEIIQRLQRLARSESN
ncbi:PspA/IM30 family protein [Planktothrix pseudagardhii]|uniref:PspA/IM30 family protein n=1 Tax=Planktothrix pseudagardhii TaxID=132604 RepID=A0A9W4CU77_9CYAN|nr:PspA/IM30 family protein [Planktothrix pseudagardhii]CAD5988671.1 hypothetical protein NO713_05760 [Planktothrix pseudagardhii]